MDGEGARDGLTSESRVEFRLRKNGRKDKVIVERSAAEGLPKGWIKEVFIRKKAGKLRKDRLYIDPKSGYMFHSFKDASRYVRTGVIGKLARKPKENSRNEALSFSGSMDGRSPENLMETEKKMDTYGRSENGESLDSLDELSKHHEMSSKPRSTIVEEEPTEKEAGNKHTKRKLISCNENDTATLNVRCVEQRVTRSQAKAKKSDDTHELGSKDCIVSSERKYVNLRTTKKTQDSMERKYDSCPMKQSIEKRVTRAHAKVMNDDNAQFKRKTELSDDSLPRGALQQPVDDEREVETTARAGQVPTVKTSDDAEAGKCKEHVLGVKPVLGNGEKTILPLIQAVARKNEENPAFGNYKASNKVVGNKKIGSLRIKKTAPVTMLCFESATVKHNGTRCRRSGPFLMLESNILPQIQTRSEFYMTSDNNIVSIKEHGCSINSVSEPVAPDPTLADLWKDPCIAFAIKTLTGDSSDPYDMADVLTEPNKSNAVNEDDKQKGVVFMDEMARNCNKSNTDPRYLPATDICKDPCIDFAIKTLTGAIPIGIDEPDGQMMGTSADLKG